MKRVTLALAVVVAALLCISSPSRLTAGPGGCGDRDFSWFEPMGFETITVSATAIGFTTATWKPGTPQPADLAVVSIESNAVRYRLDGINPTSSVGHIGAADSALSVCGAASLSRIKFIRKDAADATLTVTYYRGGP